MPLNFIHTELKICGNEIVQQVRIYTVNFSFVLNLHLTFNLYDVTQQHIYT